MLVKCETHLQFILKLIFERSDMTNLPNSVYNCQNRIRLLIIHGKPNLNSFKSYYNFQFVTSFLPFQIGNLLFNLPNPGRLGFKVVADVLHHVIQAYTIPSAHKFMKVVYPDQD